MKTERRQNLQTNTLKPEYDVYGAWLTSSNSKDQFVIESTACEGGGWEFRDTLRHFFTASINESWINSCNNYTDSSITYQSFSSAGSSSLSAFSTVSSTSATGTSDMLNGRREIKIFLAGNELFMAGHKLSCNSPTGVGRGYWWLWNKYCCKAN